MNEPVRASAFVASPLAGARKYLETMDLLEGEQVCIVARRPEGKAAATDGVRTTRRVDFGAPARNGHSLRPPLSRRTVILIVSQGTQPSPRARTSMRWWTSASLVLSCHANRRSFLSRRVAIRPSFDQSNAIEPPNCR